MKKLNPNIAYVVDNSLCTGCGLCQDVCPKNAISFLKSKGLNQPTINNDRCINDKGCSRCFDICPGKGIEIRHKSSQLFKMTGVRFDEYIGNYLTCYSGYSLNNDVRYNSASGGLLSQFLIFLLEKGEIDGAVITGFSSCDLMQPKPFIAKSRDEILKGKSSKYCPVALNGMATQLKQETGKYVVVGLPCHIQGFRNLESKDKHLKERVFGYFSIFCSSNRNYYSQDYLCSRYNINRKELIDFTYRSDGCMGYLKAKHKDSRLVKIYYRDYYHPMRSFFKPKRCLSCVDHYGDLADMCFGDIQVGDYKKDEIGVNSLIIRNNKMHTLIEQAKKEGFIKIKEVSSDIINESQKVMLHHKRHVSGTVMSLDHFFGRKVPVYDIQLSGKSTIKDYLKVLFTYLQLFIGRNKHLWFIIDRLKK